MKFAVLDFETTGNQWDDEIIQVGLILVDQDQITRTYTTYVNPLRPIPDFITALTGIRREDVEGAPTAEEMLLDLLPLLEGRILAGHHIAFDLAFLQQALRKNGYSPYTGRVLDTLDLVRICFPTLSSLQLGAISEALQVPHDRPHQADSDAHATALILLKCMERLRKLPLITVQRIASLFAAENSDLSWFWQQIRQERERIPNAWDDEGQDVFRQFALQVRDWTEERNERTEEEKRVLAETSFTQFFQNWREALERHLPEFERRISQERMMEEVYRALEDGVHLMVEAGTGTGKSLGYLLPALVYGIQNEAKIVISTHTLHLQEQLRTRDIPLLQQFFPVPFRAAVLKGRNHYLCLRKFEEKIHQQAFDDDRNHRIAAAQMVVWLGETLRGEDEEIHLGGKGREFWHTVASDADSCLNRACPWFRKCFYHRAKHQANIADVVITNHSLLFTDIKADHRILPHYDHLIVDEAHHFEEAASKHLGVEIHYFGLVGALQWLYKDARNGLLPSLRHRLSQGEAEGKWLKTVDEAAESLLKVKADWDLLTEHLYRLLEQEAPGDVPDGISLSCRLKPEALPEGWDALLTLEDNIHITLGDVIRKTEQLVKTMQDADDGLDLQSLLTDMNGAVKELAKYRDALRFFMRMPDDNSVYWLEANPQGKNRSLQFISLPVNVSSMLNQYVFGAKESVILASATLSVNQSFQYAVEQLGLSEAEGEGRLRTVQLDSHFDYRKQALVLLPRDFPSVKGANDSIFIRSLVRSLKETALELNGKMLVLFTSYQMLKAACIPLKEALLPHGIEVYAQGLDSQHPAKLIRQFQESRAGVLMGTNSFWEGVDIPGSALSCLAIVRLPFQPPNHPLVEAKCENLKKLKQNPFLKYSVPQAVIRFKQGFGRLVRTRHDRGVVIVYDTRVFETRYGKYFLSSLPEPIIELTDTDQIVTRMKKWFDEDGTERGNHR